MSKKLESIYVNLGDTSVQVTIERLVELVGIEAVKSAVDEIAAQQSVRPTLPACPACGGWLLPDGSCHNKLKRR